MSQSLLFSQLIKNNLSNTCGIAPSFTLIQLKKYCFFPGVPPVVHADGENHDKASYFTCLTVSRDFLSWEFSGHSQLTSLSSSNWMSFLILGVTSVYHLH